MNIPIEVSARHTHLSKEAVEALFGQNHQLTPKRELSQPGQFLCEERVNVIGENGILKNVAVLGPERKQTQVEISITDSIKLGIKSKIRESGDLEDTPGCVLEGPKGKYKIDSGLIISKRHIHMPPDDAKAMGVQSGQIVSVEVKSLDRSLIFNDVVVRVSDNFKLSMHIDTDEANALNANGEMYGNIVCVK